MRPPWVDKDGMKKGAWSEEEDSKLRAYVLRYGHWNWRLLPKFAGLARCGKSCRLRWVNYLKPGVKRGNYSKEEEDLIAKLHDELGNRWSAIAAKLPGRTDNEIKNYCHTHLKKRTTKVSTKSLMQLPENCMSQTSVDCNNSEEASLEDSVLSSSSSSFSAEQVQTSLQLSQGDKINEERVTNSFAEFGGTFWTQPFLVSQEDSFSSLDYNEVGLFSGYLFT